MPELSAVDAGFITVYTPTVGQLKIFSSWLWSTDLFDNLFTDALSLIVGMYISPITPTNLSEGKHITLGGRDSEASAPTVTGQYEIFDFGAIELKEFYGNFIDYKTSCIIYIPYVGSKSIDINDFMGGTIALKYLVDFATGTAIAFLSSKRGNLDGVIYQYQANIFSEVPLTSQSANALKATLVNAGINAVSNIGNPVSLATGLASSATDALFSKVPVEKSGTLTTNAGYISTQQPYLLLTRPMPSTSAYFKNDRGYMSNITAKIGNLTGYTEVFYVNLSGIQCTEEERERLMNLLQSGVYL